MGPRAARGASRQLRLAPSRKRRCVRARALVTRFDNRRCSSCSALSPARAAAAVRPRAPCPKDLPTGLLQGLLVSECQSPVRQACIFVSIGCVSFSSFRIAPPTLPSAMLSLASVHHLLPPCNLALTRFPARRHLAEFWHIIDAVKPVNTIVVGVHRRQVLALRLPHSDARALRIRLSPSEDIDRCIRTNPRSVASGIDNPRACNASKRLRACNTSRQLRTRKLVLPRILYQMMYCVPHSLTRGAERLARSREHFADNSNLRASHSAGGVRGAYDDSM